MGAGRAGESGGGAHSGGRGALCAGIFSGRAARVRGRFWLERGGGDRYEHARDSRARTGWTAAVIARVTSDGKTIVVSNRDDATVSLLDAGTLGAIATIGTAPSPEQIAILPDDSKAFITSGTSNQVSVVDLKRKVLLANLALGGTADDLDLKPDGGELYITSGSAHGLLIVNTDTN